MRAVSVSSAASHLTTLKLHSAIFLSFSPSAGATLPPRAASTTEEAPPSPSHLPVTRPRPPVPPDSRWAPRGGVGAVFGMRTTTLPVLVPLCSVRKAARTFFSRSKSSMGKPWSTNASARADSVRSVPHIHHGVWSIVESSAIIVKLLQHAAACRS